MNAHIEVARCRDCALNNIGLTWDHYGSK